MTGLRKRLLEWHDSDGAAYELGIALDLFDREEHPFLKVKHVFWTNNPVGNALHECLEKLTEAGILEGERDDPNSSHHKFRWNWEFEGDWEDDDVRCTICGSLAEHYFGDGWKCKAGCF